MSKYNSPEINRYVDSHKDPSGPGDSRPTALRIIEDNDLKGKLTDKTILITGCSSGIGVETARALSTTGARLFLTARNLDKGREALSGILEPGRVELLHLDLNSLASVHSFAREFLAVSNGRLNVFIANAGIMAVPEGTTADGFETQLGTNHLAHFLLFQLLKDALLASSTPEFNSRVVALSSMSHRIAPPNMSNLMLKGAYEPQVAYAQSKTANIWMANEIERKYGQRGLHALSVHPGIIDTGLQADMREQFESFLKTVPALQKALKTREQGAAPSVWAAVGKCWEGKGGVYLEDCTVAGPHQESSGQMGPGYAEWIYDEEKEKALWKLSNEWVGITE